MSDLSRVSTPPPPRASLAQPLTFESTRVDRYEIRVEPGLLARSGYLLRDLFPTLQEAVVVTDRNVADLYADRVLRSLEHQGLHATLLVVEPGETSKALSVATHLWDELAANRFKRRDVLLAVGGGVLVDLVGFVAATYMRGVSYVNLPTTLVAQLDAAIGSKVAVDHQRAKNLIGAFHHPAAVWADSEVLRTLPVHEVRHGLSEAIKVALVHDPDLFALIESNATALVQGDVGLLAEVVRQAIRAKIELLRPDLYERDLRRVLNFGHTTAHALETVLGYGTISHGEAVAIGMAAATRIAAARGLCEPAVAERILAVLRAVGLPTVAAGMPHEVWEALDIIRNIRDGHFHEVLPTGIGTSIFSDDLSLEDLERFMYTEAGA